MALEPKPVGNTPDLDPGIIAINAQPKYKTAKWESTVLGNVAATAKANLTYMPEEYRFTGVSINLPISENSTIFQIALEGVFYFQNI